MAPPPTYDVKRIPSVPHPGPPPIPQEQIIQKFAANEDVMKKAYDTYDFTQTLRIEEVSESGGKFIRDRRRLHAAGWQARLARRHSHRVHAQVGHLLSRRGPHDGDDSSFRPHLERNRQLQFPLRRPGQAQQAEYLRLSGQAQAVEPHAPFFEGVIWVDDHDFAIVRSYGKLVGDFHAERDALPFKMFETYRENFQEKYWLPTYTTSDDYVDQPPDAQLHLRLIIRATGFKLQPASPPPPPNPVPAN